MNYSGTARSNYVAVKNVEAFKTWAVQRKLEVFEGHDGNVGLFGISPDREKTDTGDWPNWVDLSVDLPTGLNEERALAWYASQNAEDDGMLEIDIATELAEHLVPGHVAILMEAGHEGRRFVAGRAIAVDSTKRQIALSLNDIYPLAAAFFMVPPTSINSASY